MPLSNRSKTEDETHSALAGAGLIPVLHGAWIKQRCRLERLFVQEKGSAESSLVRGERRMRNKGFLRFRCPFFERIHQVPVAPLKVFENLRQQGCGCRRIEREYAIDNVVRA